jgi:hypothetical protein
MSGTTPEVGPSPGDPSGPIDSRRAPTSGSLA